MIDIIQTIFIILIISYLILNKSNLKITFEKEKTMFKNTLVGYSIILWRKNNEYSSSGIYTIYIPIKNRKKVELAEDIERLIKDKTNQRYNLNAMFSWLKTWKEVKEFEKKYSIVNEELVRNLVSNFKEK